MRRLGQHFLFDPSILKRIVEVSGVGPDDLVVEIGSGHGRLTALLAERVKKVIAIEIDPLLIREAKKALSHYKNIELIEMDALKFPYEELGPFKVVSNIPYYITTPIIFRLLNLDSLISMTLTVQKEVAQRIVAGPGSKTYSVLSIMVQYKGRPEIKFLIPRGAFRPVPEVDSAVIYIEMLREPYKVADEQLFKRVVKTAFSSRRKTLLNSLKTLKIDNIKKLLEECDINPQRRPETLSIEEFVKITEKIALNLSSGG